MKRRFMFAFPPIMLALLALGGLVVMLLWNAILPHIAAVSAINFWQATGLLILSRILFGGFRGGGPWRHRGMPPQWKNQWADLSEADREKMKEAWKKGWGGMSWEEKQKMKDEFRRRCSRGAGYQPGKTDSTAENEGAGSATT